MCRVSQAQGLPGFRKMITLVFVVLLGFVWAAAVDSDVDSDQLVARSTDLAPATVESDAERSERFAREMYDASGGRLTQVALASLTASYACFRRGEQRCCTALPALPVHLPFSRFYITLDKIEAYRELVQV